jgi:CheY-like chemotaxis protein
MADNDKTESGLDTARIIAAAAHDMRQPLHSLSLMLEALADRAGDDKAAALAEAAQVSADGVSGVIESLLAIAVMRAGAAAQTETFAIGELLDHCRDQYTRQAENKGLALTVVPCSLAVKSDRRFLQRALDVLLASAIRHCDRGRVLLGCRRSGSQLLVGVLDSGPGLDGEVAARFANGSEGAAEREMWRGGALAISIARELAAATGHSLQVASQPGRGTSVWLSVARDGLVEPLPQAVNEPAAVGEPSAENEALIVVVEDEKDVLEVTVEMLQDWGYAVIGGDSAEAAIANCTAQTGGRRPDLLLTDFMLPGSQTGVDVIEKLGQHFGAPIPAIILSGDPSAAQQAAARMKDIRIVQKPIRAMRLHQLVDEALASETSRS